MKKGIEVAGTLIVDIIKEINHFPHEGELVYINKTIKSVGGLVPNDSIDIKKIDSSIEVMASGKIGDDDNGLFLTQTLNKCNIINNLKICNKPTSFTDALSILGGQRTFLNYPGATDEFGLEDVSFDYSMLHLGYFTLLKKIDEGDGLKILKKAKEKGIITSIDMVSSDVDKYHLIIQCLKYVDNLIINEYEAGKLLNEKVDENNLLESAKKLKKLGVIDRVIIHMPSKCCLVDNKEVIEEKSLCIPPKMIVGTTGAGDAFCSGCLVGIYHKYDNKKILKIASTVASSSLFNADATSSIISLNEVDSFYEKYRG